MSLIRDNAAKIDLFGLSPLDFNKLLTHVLRNIYLRFGQEYFKQTTGIAMGSRIAQPVAISFMHILESSFLSFLTLWPDFLVRYIDDYFGIWSHGRKNLKIFFDQFNTFNPAIKLTMEHTGESAEIAFLDTLLTLRANGACTTELYIKPMTAPHNYALPLGPLHGYEKGILKSQIKRAIKLSSDPEAKERSLNRMSVLFRGNDYPLSVINQTIRNCTRSHLHSSQSHRKYHDSLLHEASLR